MTSNTTLPLTVKPPTIPPPCTDFITNTPMSVSISAPSSWRDRSGIVQTTDKETLLKIQRSSVPIGTFRTRPQYRFYSADGLELILTNHKERRDWSITWPKQEGGRECRLKEYFRVLSVDFSNPVEDGLVVGFQRRKNEIVNEKTGQVPVTAKVVSLWHLSSWHYEYVLMMEKGVDVVLMSAIMMCKMHIRGKRDDAGVNGGSGLLLIGGGAAC